MKNREPASVSGDFAGSGDQRLVRPSGHRLMFTKAGSCLIEVHATTDFRFAYFAGVEGLLPRIRGRAYRKNG